MLSRSHCVHGSRRCYRARNRIGMGKRTPVTTPEPPATAPAATTGRLSSSDDRMALGYGDDDDAATSNSLANIVEPLGANAFGFSPSSLSGAKQLDDIDTQFTPFIETPVSAGTSVLPGSPPTTPPPLSPASIIPQTASCTAGIRPLSRTAMALQTLDKFRTDMVITHQLELDMPDNDERFHSAKERISTCVKAIIIAAHLRAKGALTPCKVTRAISTYARTHLPLPIITIAANAVYQLGLANKCNWKPALTRLGITLTELTKAHDNAECCSLMIDIYRNRRRRYMYRCRSIDPHHGEDSRKTARIECERLDYYHEISCTRLLSLTSFDDIEPFASYFQFPSHVVLHALGSTSEAAERVRRRVW